METPDRWLVVKINTYYRLYATYIGGYESGDRWRLNSGIERVTKKDGFYYFHGSSGSIYKCYENGYGSTTYTMSVLQDIIDKAKQHNIDIEILSENTDFINLKY